jgi:hypothetical protein
MQAIKRVLEAEQIKCLSERFNLDRINHEYNRHSNNNIIHDVPKDGIDYYIIRPVGRRCYLWFTYIDKQFVALIKYTGSNSDDFYVANIDFDNTLSYNNVLLYGYYVKTEGSGDFFIIDNIINYNDYNYIITDKEYSLISVFKVYRRLLQNINAKSGKLGVYLPYICSQYSEVFSAMYSLAYRPFGVSIWTLDKNQGIYLLNRENNVLEGIFKVKANPNHDTYDLYCYNGNRMEYYNRSLITNYTLSIYMNSLYRNIAENKNLDALEESEDEDIFENIHENKFVDLEKSYYFKCVYNKRFKKWIPKCLIENPKICDIITRRQLFNIENK